MSRRFSRITRCMKFQVKFRRRVGRLCIKCGLYIAIYNTGRAVVSRGLVATTCCGDATCTAQVSARMIRGAAGTRRSSADDRSSRRDDDRSFRARYLAISARVISDRFHQYRAEFSPFTLQRVSAHRSRSYVRLIVERIKRRNEVSACH